MAEFTAPIEDRRSLTIRLVVLQVGFIERTRAQGIIQGPVEDGLVRMEFVPATADVKAGDTVVTSGVDGIYPKGFVIGKVEQIDNGNGIYKVIRVRPSVDFTALEEVLVVKTPPAKGLPPEEDR